MLKLDPPDGVIRRIPGMRTVIGMLSDEQAGVIATRFIHAQWYDAN